MITTHPKLHSIQAIHPSSSTTSGPSLRVCLPFERLLDLKSDDMQDTHSKANTNVPQQQTPNPFSLYRTVPYRNNDGIHPSMHQQITRSRKTLVLFMLKHIQQSTLQPPTFNLPSLHTTLLYYTLPYATHP